MQTCEKIEAPTGTSSSGGRNCDVVIVGAGPYGLSLAAHLKAQNVDFRIFGNPMHTWREQMPQGMFLKSDGFASSLSDPGRELTLKQYCAQHGIAYDDTRLPVSRDTFTAYGLAFQKRFAPELEEKMVSQLDQEPNGRFRLKLDTGETFTANAVVLAIGITHYKYLPESLSGLLEEYLTHSSAHYDLAKFRGKSVLIIGGGASAGDLAASLREAGASASIVARHSMRFHDAPSSKPRSLWERLRHPGTGIGPGWKSRFYTDAPVLFHRLPQDLRLRTVRTHLGPAAGWFVKDKVVGHVPILERHIPERASVRDGKICVTFRADDGSSKEVIADHVIAATGYRVDLKRLEFLSESIRTRIRSVENTPVLSSVFESSIPGIFFLGVSAANSFGPLMRFAYGADFSVRRITPQIVRKVARANR